MGSMTDDGKNQTNSNLFRLNQGKKMRAEQTRLPNQKLETKN